MNRPMTSPYGALLCAYWMVNAAQAGVEISLDEQARMEIGFWTQAWHQFVENGSIDDENLNDFMVRRAYLSLNGQASERLRFFTHIAADRVGQQGLDDSSLGLGSGVAFRDLWITANLSEALKIQLGRMYVPVTRNFGTTSTKSLLTVDLPFLQGGVRGNIFYANKVGRDDGITFWGNPSDGAIQYRLMLSEGVENDANAGDSLRLAGRVAFNFLEPETGWFNQGTYLGQKEVLSLGFGYDTQSDLTLNGIENQDNRVWTVDAFFDKPLGRGALTMEAAYIDIRNSTQTHNFSDLAAGDDADNWYVQAGYLLPSAEAPSRIQPYARYEKVEVGGKAATDFISYGVNYYIKGHDAKISLEHTLVGHDGARRDRDIVTVQAAVGF